MKLAGSYIDASVSGLGALGAGTPAGAVSVAMKKYEWINSTPDPAPTAPRPDDSLIFTDPYGYLRAVVNAGDWRAVARWYATRINEILEHSTNPSDFWALSNVKIGNYINSDRLMTRGDFAAFTRNVVFPYIILDLGNKVGFGVASGIGGQIGQLAAFTDTSSSSGQISWRGAADSFSKYGNGTFNLGWVKEPSDHLASRIIVAIGVGIMTAGAASAILAPAAGAGGTAAGVGTGGVTASGAAGAVVPVGIETVVVTAAAPAIITAGGAAIGAGAAAVAAAAPPPPLSTPDPLTIETVVTEAAAIPSGTVAGTVGAGVAAGAITAVATAPPIIDMSNVIETVVTTGKAPEPFPVDAATTAATGLVTVGITQPVINVPEPTLPEIEGDQSLLDRVKDIAGNIGDIISGFLGLPTGAAPGTDTGNGLPNWLNPTDVKNPSLLDYLKSPLIWGPLLLVIAAAAMGKKRKKVRRKRHRVEVRK